MTTSPTTGKDDEFSNVSCEQLQLKVNDQFARFPCITKDELEELGRMQQEYRARCTNEECQS